MTAPDPTPSLLARLTLEEKASLLSGSTFWATQQIERDGEVLVPPVLMTDGPHGLRKQEGAGTVSLGPGTSAPATCFPPAVALAASFDAELVAEVAAAIGAEARAEGIAVVLGPGVNIKRSPLGGRNFEYFSEDPLLAGQLAAAYVRGLQGQGVGASLKHYAVNNQEHDRMRVSADVDERTLREIYLKPFERVVREAQPWTVMCSYNRVNGTHASEHPWLLTEVLREEWGFTGLVVSDWGAVRDRVAALAAGLDLEMPTTGGVTDAEVVAAVRAGRLEEQQVDTAAGRVLDLVHRARPSTGTPAALHERHHALAREVAARCVVLLRNEPVAGEPLLPLSPTASVAVVGELARTPRYQGGGSSLVNPTRLDSLVDSLLDPAPDSSDAGAERPGFAAGYTLDGVAAPALRSEAVAAAQGADVTVLVLGLPPGRESEGFDRGDLDLPADQLELLAAVRAVTDRLVVVLAHGGVVLLPFAGEVPALVDAGLLGQAGGAALADVLTGRANPSARLAETIPLRVADTPAFLNFPGERGHVGYGERGFVCYRWYDARDLPVAFPFGHGLSYTTFAYDDLAVCPTADEDIAVRLTVTNTGTRPGREVVQVYVGLADSQLARPPRELAGTTIVELAPGQSRPVELTVPRHDLERWFAGRGWVLEPGTYQVAVGASSRDLRGHAEVTLTGDDLREPLHLESTVTEVLADPVAGPFLQAGLAEFGPAGVGPEGVGPEGDDPEGIGQMLASVPIARVVRMAGGAIALADVQALLDAANAERG